MSNCIFFLCVPSLNPGVLNVIENKETDTETKHNSYSADRGKDEIIYR